MNYFYVDFENVKVDGLNGISRLNKNDVVRIYYSDKADKITFGTHRRINDSSAVFEYCRIKDALNGVKNALDVKLMEDISNLMSQKKDANYFIVSNDKDYDSFIQKYNNAIRRIGEISQYSCGIEVKEVENNKNQKNRKSDEKKEQIFRSYFGRHLKDYNKYKEDIVGAYMESSTKLQLNNNLLKCLHDNEKVSKILDALKTLVEDWPGR